MSAGLPRFHIVAVGGNSELSSAKGPGSMRSLSASGDLQQMLVKRHIGFESAEVSCTYYAWTGTPRSNDWIIPVPPMHLNGANRIVRQEGSTGVGMKLIIIGWSNGGDTAFNAAKRIGETRKVDALITLDPVSRVSSLHWLPFLGTFSKPAGVARWFHVHTTSWGDSFAAAVQSERAGLDAAGQAALDARLEETGAFNGGNAIAAIGGAWGEQREADLNIALAGNHGHTVPMLQRVTGSEPYRQFLADCKAGK